MIQGAIAGPGGGRLVGHWCGTKAPVLRGLNDPRPTIRNIAAVLLGLGAIVALWTARQR